MTKKYTGWIFGYDGWIYSEDCKCYIHRHSGVPLNAPPTSYCLGDRYIHCAPGVDTYGVIWMGSTSDNWHCSNFGIDLGAALRWVQEAEAKVLECKLWSKPEYETVVKSYYAQGDVGNPGTNRS